MSFAHETTKKAEGFNSHRHTHTHLRMKQVPIPEIIDKSHFSRSYQTEGETERERRILEDVPDMCHLPDS